ncbi:hypothetical protein A3D71_02925 [Candidatus Kaiserbacteria bacterium RIFCSPHIGHO2_02_FULL_55_20]|uniref:Uncharacterized protein n=1 Tax=Candidatus Kaiserbacteria bacterium RIFCSPHIGHO2_02_FULL_55_20 TaxID=1798497 RepID=A0A1F6DW45_9BACT|nr:MAG: hypothetical protein A2680_01300 [Candidatus Kaiserbacteria bacterium RIFCSPHIGHO2_01_FULL_55_37]OGG65641.1 MAG: hypothetical protein A3D71_02925 [Candidatus Kaiserbacteria bacterium RIFCSPHIGHO2_02_FULL_55_20]
MTISIGIFLLSLFCIVALFAGKYWELRSERVLLPVWREKLDMRAQQLKELMDAARVDVAKLPPEALRVSRIAVHQLALGFAAFARTAEGYAHRLADVVSYKHRFEKRDTRSEFLKKVAEHKSGNGSNESGGNNTTSQL